jgi:hypothetical protein
MITNQGRWRLFFSSEEGPHRQLDPQALTAILKRQAVLLFGAVQLQVSASPEILMHV